MEHELLNIIREFMTVTGHSRKKRTSPKSDPIMGRLAAYSATAGAALLVAPAANAAIHNITTFSYDGGNTFIITPPDVIGSPLNSFQSIPFLGATAGHLFGFYGALGANHLTNPISNSAFVGIYCSSAAIAVTYSGYRGINLSPGALITAATNFNSSFLRLASRRTTTGGKQYTHGSFMPAGANATKTGYVGFRYGTGSQPYYGWLRVKVSADGNGFPGELSLVDKNNDGIYGAFGLASDNITAGEIAGVAEPSVAAIGGLGLLALGAVGVRELRRRRQQAAGN